MNQLLYDNWLSKFYIVGSQICLNTSSQTTPMWKARNYIINNKWISDEPILIIKSSLNKNKKSGF